MADLLSPSTLAPCDPAVVERQIADHIRAAEHHMRAAQVLTATLAAAATGRPTMASGQIVSLKEASRQTGWPVKRIKSHIQRRALEQHLPQLGYQPGGMANSPWCVFLDVLVPYIAGQPALR